MAKPIRNVGASVRARLQTLAKERNQPLDLLLVRYALERFLYRLSRSQFGGRFALKGAMLLTTWFDEPHRPTRDLDLLGFGDPAADPMLAVFREICATPVEDDGLVFDLDGLRVDQIREELAYGGLRLRTTAQLAGARLPITIDIGFGDAVEPGLEEIDLPVLLNMPAPHLRAYPQETVIAEKFQAMVMLGRANSRMKDFYDIWVLSKQYEFEGDRLPRAIAATFRRRETEIPLTLPDALTAEFAGDIAKARQWAAFAANLTVAPPSLEQILADLSQFLMPHAEAARLLHPRSDGPGH
jgi:predicted nucleotidyltransferase component of viral defense system